MKLICKIRRAGDLRRAVAVRPVPSLESDKIDYKSASKASALEVPPDLTQLSRDSRYAVPGGAVTASSYQVGQAAPAMPTAATDAGRRAHRARRHAALAGGQPPGRPAVGTGARLLAGERLPADAWTSPTWASWKPTGPRTAPRSRRTSSAARWASCSTRSTPPSERDRFRTRLERSANGGTEIFISHRGMVEVYNNSEKDQTVWQPRPTDPELEAEFLRRLMVKLGVPQEQTKALVATRRGQADLARRGRRQPARGADRRRLRPRLAPRRPGAGPHRLHGGRPRPRPGHLLRPLRAAQRGQEGHRASSASCSAARTRPRRR